MTGAQEESLSPLPHSRVCRVAAEKRLRGNKRKAFKDAGLF